MSKMKHQSFVFTATSALLVLFVTACNTQSSVEFKGDRALLGAPTDNLNSQITPTDGGFMNQRTPSNYQTSLTVGSQLEKSTVTTTGGYKVQLNFEGQVTK